MDRIQFLRSRLKKSARIAPAKPQGIYSAEHPENRQTYRKRQPVPEVANPRVMRGATEAGNGLGYDRAKLGWIVTPAKRRNNALGAKERRRANALTRIAEQLPAKLPKLLVFSNGRQRRLGQQ